VIDVESVENFEINNSKSNKFQAKKIYQKNRRNRAIKIEKHPRMW